MGADSFAAPAMSATMSAGMSHPWTASAAEVVASGYSGADGSLYSWSFGPEAIGAAKPWPQFRRRSNNHAVYVFEMLLDGFETGDFSAWSAAVP